MQSFSCKTINNLSRCAVTRAETCLENCPGISGGGFFNEGNNREFFLRR